LAKKNALTKGISKFKKPMPKGGGISFENEKSAKKREGGSA